ncbi:MAG: FG-GAP-like repeat-containing protein, partial [Acidobacteriia bacterium]|nr:FG-GAP-like repeat-containing protein [Terriglobia bacterium]
NSLFGSSLAVGDFNNDGKTDLAVGAYGYNSNQGRVYLFYQNNFPSSAASASAIITGEGTGYDFGSSLAVGDFNNDGKTDLAIGSPNYSTNTGRTYLFYQNNFPAAASSASAIIAGEATWNFFGSSLAAGDFNNDGKTDLAIGATGYNYSQGKIFYYSGQSNYAWNLERPTDGVRISGATGEELKTTGENGTSKFGTSFAAGDFNRDGKIDLAVGAPNYSSNTGRIYIFYNDGSIPNSAGSPDAVITGETTGDYFGNSIASADLNQDGKTDLVVSAKGNTSGKGRVYIFYQGSSYPASAASASATISGENTGDAFGTSLATGDLNADGKMDLVVGATAYSSSQGRVYLFYQSNFPAGAGSASAIITGENTGDQFGASLAAGSLNSATDGKTDLAVGAPNYSSNTGRTYLFYQNNFPAGAGSADAKISGENTGDAFGTSLAAGDFNADGKTDLAVGAPNYSSNTGRTYLFYQNNFPAGAGSADVKITGEAANNYFGSTLAALDINYDGRLDLAVGAYGFNSNQGRIYIYTLNDITSSGESGSALGTSLAVGDFNSDGKPDLAVGAPAYNSNQGRIYIFYNNNGSMKNTAASADKTITGESTGDYFGYSLISADLNADGKTDLAVGAYGYSSSEGRVYLFYQGTTNPTSAANANVIITGETGAHFGTSLAAGSLTNNVRANADLAVGAPCYNSNQGRVYLFYNDGIYPTTAGTADVTVTGENTGDYFGNSLAIGNLNTSNGKSDLAVGAPGYNSSQGRAYLFYNDGAYPTTAGTADVTVTGENTGDYFGYSFAIGDLNADGKTDLAVGANQCSSGAGRAYIFYNDGSYPAGAGSAEVILSGEASSQFGTSLTAADLNADGRMDLAVGASAYNSNQGRTYVFYNDGAYPLVAASADLTMTGDASSYYGSSLASADFNTDGKADLAIGALGGAGKFNIIISEAKAASSLEQNLNTIKARGNVKFKGNIKFK